jgi:hypothetical protein
LLFFWKLLKFKSVEIWFFLSLFIDWSSVQLQIFSLMMLTNPSQWIYVCKYNFLLLGLYPSTQLLHVLHVGDRVSENFADNNIIWFRKIYSFI